MFYSTGGNLYQFPCLLKVTYCSIIYRHSFSVVYLHVPISAVHFALRLLHLCNDTTFCVSIDLKSGCFAWCMISDENTFFNGKKLVWP